MQKSKTYELRRRLLFTILILAVYMVGRSLLLFHVDASAYELENLNSENLVVSMVSGDRYRYTVFALGIMPYITASLIVQIALALCSREFRSRFSPKKIERITFLVFMGLAVGFAVSRARSLVFKESVLDAGMLQLIAVLEMLAGAIVVYRLADLNKKHGIAAQMVFILVNIIDNLLATLRRNSIQELKTVGVLCLVMVVIALFLENVLVKIPVQRVSIHNEYADESYIAFKLNPIGVMPVMFAVTFFMLPQLIIRLLLFLNQDSLFLKRLNERMTMTDPVGVGVYLSIIFILTVLFSFIMLSPGNMAEQLQRGGDSIVGIYAGKKTRWYLRRKLLLLSVFSGTVLSIMMGVSLSLSLKGDISSELAMLPSTAMILTSITCTLCQEIITYRRFDAYSFFM